MKLIDLTGQKFGKWTVLYQVKDKSSTTWRCKCDCGNEKDVAGRYLRNGQSQSCGCLRKEQCKNMGKNNIHNLIGQKFGALTVIKQSDKKMGSNIIWTCQCDCGNIHDVAGADLVCGKTKSCGCQRYNKEMLIKDIVGQRFGKLIVLKRVNKDIDGSYNYLCQCDCGNQKIVNGVSLRNGTTKSCGCINYSIGEQNIKEILDKNNIIYAQEYSVKELNNKRFDFAIYDKNNNIIRLIEFDGRQHYEPYPDKWEKDCPLEIRQERDKIKNEYALSHNIPLIRIPYWERDNITLEMLLGEQYLVKS